MSNWITSTVKGKVSKKRLVKKREESRKSKEKIGEKKDGNSFCKIAQLNGGWQFLPNYTSEWIHSRSVKVIY